MNILITTDNYPPRWDGVGRFLTEIIPRLPSSNITVVSPDYGDYSLPKTTHVTVPTTNYEIGDYTLPKPRRSTIRDLVHKADIVFGQTIGPIGSIGGWYARQTNTPLIHYTHSIEWQLVPQATNQHALKRLTKQITRWYARRYYNRTNHIITPSRTIQESLHYEGIKTQGTVAPLGVDHDTFKPVDQLSDPEQTQVKTYRDTITDDDTVLIGYHGRFAREKDLLTLLRGIKRLKKRRDNFHLVVIGDGLDYLRDKIDADSHASTLPVQTDIHRYVQAFDIYVTTTLTETTSLSTAEAMACGKPVVATPAGYIGDYIDHGENGYLIDFKDHYSLSEHLRELIDHPERRRTFGEAAWKTAKTTFNWDKTSSIIQDVLEKHA